MSSTLDQSIPSAIADFFDAAARLRTLRIIRSDKYLGDIAEFICSHFFEIELAASGRQVGYDGKDNEGNVQIKYHGSSTRTNIDLGDPAHYESVLVVLGPASMLRAAAYADDFLLYRMSSATVREHARKNKTTYSCGRKPFARPPDKTFNLRPQILPTLSEPKVTANP